MGGINHLWVVYDIALLTITQNRQNFVGSSAFRLLQARVIILILHEFGCSAGHSGHPVELRRVGSPDLDLFATSWAKLTIDGLNLGKRSELGPGGGPDGSPDRGTGWILNAPGSTCWGRCRIPATLWPWTWSMTGSSPVTWQ
jgi:hypothetical protein